MYQELVSSKVLILISWWAINSLSSPGQVLKQAEYKCLAPATSELLWAQFLLTEPKVSYSTHIVLCDNMSTIALACNSVLRARTKHVELDLFFVREKVFSKQLKVIYVSG